MEIQIILKLFALALLVMAINLILSKSGKDEYSSLVNMAGIIMGLLIVLAKAKELYDYIITTFTL